MSKTFKNEKKVKKCSLTLYSNRANILARIQNPMRYLHWQNTSFSVVEINE
jgi:hypothetical protein